eukprot:scaffold88768_cov19-Prasinocladus_malaysianus.AAC.1
MRDESEKSFSRQKHPIKVGDAKIGCNLLGGRNDLILSQMLMSLYSMESGCFTRDLALPCEQFEGFTD